MRISSGLSGALQENMYDGITVLGTISEGRFFPVCSRPAWVRNT